MTLQAVTLLAFNSDSSPKSFESLLAELSLADEVLKRVLHSLSCGKFKVLKRLAGREGEKAAGGAGSADPEKDRGAIRATDSFAVNEAFR